MLFQITILEFFNIPLRLAVSESFLRFEHSSSSKSFETYKY